MGLRIEPANVVMLSTYYLQYILSTYCLHIIHILCTYYLHITYILSAYYLHINYISSAYHLHIYLFIDISIYLSRHMCIHVCICIPVCTLCMYIHIYILYWVPALRRIDPQKGVSMTCGLWGKLCRKQICYCYCCIECVVALQEW